MTGGAGSTGGERSRHQDAHERLQRFWDADAEIYDRSPTHAGTDPVEAAAWRAALIRYLPDPGASVLDVGAGTGAISLLAAELGYRVTALDLSPAMLDVAARKAAERGLDLETVIGPATEPPEGPFDVVVERHLLWTLPDPAGALRAWRQVAPRLASFEGVFATSGIGHDLRHAAASMLRTLSRLPPEHHDEYERDLVASLPLASRMRPDTLIDALAEAGWRRFRLERLRDVEWARRIAAPGLLGWVQRVPHFALVAEA
jgi:SAM-dependent methyltransferase